MSTKPRMNLNMLGNELKDSAKQSLQGLGSLNLSQEGNRTSVPDNVAPLVGAWIEIAK